MRLERADLVADGAGGQIQFGRGRGKARRPGGGFKGAQPCQGGQADEGPNFYERGLALKF
jgi:hypothetical protein